MAHGVDDEQQNLKHTRERLELLNEQISATAFLFAGDLRRRIDSIARGIDDFEVLSAHAAPRRCGHFITVGHRLETQAERLLRAMF